MITHSISAVVLPGLIQAANSLGMDAKSACSQAGISPELLDIEHKHISIEQFECFMALLAHQAQGQAIALQLGACYSFEFVGPIKTFIYTAATLRDALLLCERLQLVVQAPAKLLQFEEKGKYARLQILPVGPGTSIEVVLAELFLAAGFKLINDLYPGISPIESINFKHRQKALLPDYNNHFNVPVKLGCSSNALVLSVQALDKPLPGAYPEIQTQANAWLERYQEQRYSEHDVLKQVYALIVAAPFPAQITIEQVALQLTTSPRTLQRWLRDAEVSFRELKQDALLKLANQTLKNTNISIEDIAEQLGFSDRRSFSRAYLQWTGMTPKSFRDQERAPKTSR